MSHVISCPSGLTGRIRGMKVREERVLADRKLAKSGGQVVTVQPDGGSGAIKSHVTLLNPARRWLWKMN